jgi:4-aminobutyrate aminotransferase-like enzyme
MALAQISEIKKLNLCDHSAKLGKFLVRELNSVVTRHSSLATSTRGLGLMVGVEINFPDGKPATQPALDAIKQLLHRGYIFLPEGEHANIISFTPPLTISQTQLHRAVAALAEVLAGI